MDSQIAELDQKWSDRFNRLEVLLLARTIEPTSANVKVTPTHSPPASAAHSTEPFIRLAQPGSASTEFPGSGFSVEEHQPTSQTETSRPTSATKLHGTGSSASKHQPTSKAKTNLLTSTTELPGTGSSAAKHQPTPLLPSNSPPARSGLTDLTNQSTHVFRTSTHRLSCTTQV